MYGHFSYLDFIKGFQNHLDIITNHRIQSYQSNYSSRNILRHEWNENKYTNELPAAILTINPVYSSNDYGKRNVVNNLSDDQILLSRNNTKDESIYVRLEETMLNVGLRINVYESLQTLDFLKIFTDAFPINRWHYPYEYDEYVEIERTAVNWDFENEDIENVLRRTERSTGKLFYMSKYKNQPMFQLNTLDSEVDNDTMRHAITANFQVKLYLPDSMVLKDTKSLKDIVPVMDILNDHTEPKTPIYTEVNDVNQYIDEVVKTSILVNPNQINKAAKTFIIDKEKAEKLGITETNYNNNHPKSLLFIDTDNYKLQSDKELLTIKLENPENVGNNFVYDIANYSDDLDILDFSDRTLITISVFGDR